MEEPAIPTATPLPSRDEARSLFRVAAVIQVLALLVLLFGDIGFDKPGRFGLDYGHALLLSGLWLIASIVGLVAAGWMRRIGLVFLQLAMAAVSIALVNLV